MSHYYFKKKKLIKKKKKTFNFLNISNVYSDIERKNVLQIIKGFLKLYKDNDKIKLNLVISNAKLDKKLYEKIKNIKKVNKNIKIFTNYISNNKIKDLYNITDVYVSLHRSEGFGITIADAIALAIPVMVTGYSGNMDFCDPNYNLIVKHKLIKVGHERLRYRKNESWAQPDQKDFELKMLDVVKNFSKYKKLALDYKKITLKDLSKNEMSLLVKNRLNLIFNEFEYENNLLNRKIEKKYEAFKFYGL